MSKKEIEIKTWVTRDEMVKYLQDLAACLAQGKVVLERGGEHLEFNPSQSLELELAGVHKKGQQKISIEMVWRQVALEPYDEPLKISPEAPPTPAPPEPTEAVASPAAEPPTETSYLQTSDKAGKGKGDKQSGK